MASDGRMKLSSQKMDNIQADKVPHSVEAENAVIASCLINSDIYPDVRAIVEVEDFFTPQAKDAFAAMNDLYPGIDFLTVYEATKGKVNIDYLSNISANIPTSIHANYYANIVKNLSCCRKLINAGGEIAAIGYEARHDIYGAFLDAVNKLHQIEPQGKEDILDGKEIANHIMTMMSKRSDKNIISTVPFGYVDLDILTAGGMGQGNMVVVGARPGVGKSQLLIEIGLNARFRDYSVMIASAEMTIDEWCEREIAINTGISVECQRRGEGDKQAIQFSNTVSSHKYYWLADPVTISRIVNKARTLKHSKGLDLLIVDYIQLICDSVSKDHGSSIREKVGYISRTLKRLAKELNIPVIVAAQLNREIEMRSSKVPVMSDIKEAGDIEQDADIIILMHRPSLYDPQDEPNITRLYVPKIRQIGKIACIKLTWKDSLHHHVDIYNQ